jgi:thiaminase
MGEHAAEKLVARARAEITGPVVAHRFLELLEAGDVPRERLRWLAGEEYRIVCSDRRSFALLAWRFAEPPAGAWFLSLAQGEGTALGLLGDFAAALDWAETDLRAYRTRPFAQAYPAFLAQCAQQGTRSAVALAMLVNLAEWSEYCGRTAEALRARYGLSERAVGFFRFFGEPPQGFAEQAVAIIEAGLAAGDDPAEALHAAHLLHAYETAFWETLADGL